MPHQNPGPTVLTESSNLRIFFILLKGLFFLNLVNFLAIESISVASFLKANILLLPGFADSDLEGVGGGGGRQSRKSCEDLSMLEAALALSLATSQQFFSIFLSSLCLQYSCFLRDASVLQNTSQNLHFCRGPSK